MIPKTLSIYHCDNRNIMAELPDESIDVICTDPPYLYLKGQKLERAFDEQHFFSECKRVLKQKGFIVLFGRGESFYRWNTILAGLGLIFKEEIVWDKMRITSPMNSLGRRHETISIHSNGNATINKVKLPLVDAYKFEPRKIEETIYRLSTVFGNRETFKMLSDYYSTGVYSHDEGNVRKFNPTLQTDIKKANRTLQFAVKLEEGVMEKSILMETHDTSTIHPTQKPVKLIERLLALVIPDKPRIEITVLDPFGGSFSTMEAVYNMGMKGVSYEIDREYFEAGENRLKKLSGIQNELF